MQVDLSNMKIENEEQFVELIKQINADIAFHNITKSKEDKEQLLDVEYLLKRYRKIKDREDKRAFRKFHDCEYCLYYEKPRKCYATKQCPLEARKQLKKNDIIKRPVCPKDKEGGCPYGNEVGTCFGFCFQEILSEFHKNKKERKITATETEES